MKRVLVESPYRGNNYNNVELNVRYGCACLRDCLLRDEAPFASHLLYTLNGVFDDKNPAEREKGIKAGWAWGEAAELSAFYVDLITDWKHFVGIARGYKRAIEKSRPVEFRNLPDDVLNLLDPRIVPDRKPIDVLVRELSIFLESLKE